MQTFAPAPAHFQSMSGPPPANPYLQSYMPQPTMFQPSMPPSFVNTSTFPSQLPMSQSGSVMNSTTSAGLTTTPASSAQQQQSAAQQHMFQLQPQMMMQHGYPAYQPSGYPGTYLQPAHVLQHPQAPYYPPNLSTSLPIANSTNSSVSNAAASAVAAAMAAATASNAATTPGTAVSAAKELALLSGVSAAGVKRKFSDDKTASPATATVAHTPSIVATPADYPRATRVKIEHAQLSTVPVRAATSVSPLPATIQHTVGSHAQMRRYKHKEVEVRRRRKIANLFNELSELLECGPTDKASMLALASKFIRKAKERGMKPNDPEEESDKSVSSSQSLSPVQSHQTLGKKPVPMTSGPASAATVVVSAVTTPVASDSAETSEQINSAAAAAALAKAKAAVKTEPTEEEEEGEDEEDEEDDA